jgi:phosphoglycolate phosphatase
MAPLIAFDLDGTLVDSRLDLADSANALLAEHHAAPLAADTVARFVGDGARKLVERTLEAAGIETDVAAALDRFLALYDQRLLVHTRPYPGLAEAVAGIGPRTRLAVVTNKPEAMSRRILEAFALASYFPWVIGGDSRATRKPDPAGLREVMAAAGSAPGETLFVGDSDVDVETARRAGTRVCVAAYGFGQARRPIDLRGDEWVAARPSDVAGILEAFLAAAGPN